MHATNNRKDEAVSCLLSGELWSKFCDDLKAAGDDVQRLDTEDPLDAVEGYRMLTQIGAGWAQRNALMTTAGFQWRNKAGAYNNMVIL